MSNKLIIIGSGPAGYAAGIYAARAELAPVILAGSEPGGQLMKTTEIDNYPGTAAGTTGPMLMIAMQEQASRFGAQVVYETAQKISKSSAGFEVVTESQKYQAEAVILTMGASPRMLGIGEEKYWGKGLSTCAVCDAAFYKGKKVVLVGGGDAAIEDALALAKFASQVVMVVRRDKLRASVAMQKKLEQQTKIEIIWNAVVTGLIGEEKIEKVEITVNGTDKQNVDTDGLFLAIGHIPATGFLQGSGVEFDSEGYIKIDSDSDWPTMTSVAGIFAGGDCVDRRYRQAVIAAGMGVSAFLDTERWLETQTTSNFGESEHQII